MTETGTNCGCCAVVKQSEVGIIQRCGKFEGTAPPGLHLLCCCCGSVLAGVVSTRLMQLDVRCETKTRDNVFVLLTINVQYQVIAQREREAFYSLDNPHQQIRSYVYDVVRSAVPRIPLDKVFEQKEDIANSVKNELTEAMGEYGWQILQVLIADIEPDPKVKSAMNEINAAQRIRIATVDKAEADKIVIVKKAEAEAEAMYLGGVGIAKQRKAIIEGLRDSVLSFDGSVQGSSPREVMDIVMVTQYFDTLKDLSEKSHPGIVFLPGGGSDGNSTALPPFKKPLPPIKPKSHKKKKDDN